MNLRVVTLPWSAKLLGFDEARLVEAERGYDVSGYDTHWTTVDGREMVVLTLRLNEMGAVSPDADSNDSQSDRNQRYRELLDWLKEKLPLERVKIFNDLKSWRGSRIPEGQKPYYIANDRNLLELVLRAPKSVAECQKMGGFKNVFYEQFAEEALAFVKDLEPIEYEIPAELLKEGDGRRRRRGRNKKKQEEVKAQQEELKAQDDELNNLF